VNSAKVADHTLGTRDLTRAAVRSLRGQRGPRGLPGPKGDPGSDATLQGVAAGGALAGSYPNPSLAPGAVQPAALAVMPAAIVTTGAGVAVANQNGRTVPFDTEESDTAGLHDPAAPTRLTAPIGGRYLATASVTWQASAGGGRRTFVRLGHAGDPSAGELVAGVAEPPEPDGTSSQAVAAIVDLAAGDFVELGVFQNSGASLNLIPNGTHIPALTLTWVGRAS
jgi:hypothetical protein